MRTSVSDPLAIAELTVGTKGGAVGVTFAPGKHQAAAMTGAWARDLVMDVSAIRDWGAKHLIFLLEPWEFKELSIEGLPAVAAEQGISWHGLPITDGSAPDERLLENWPQLSAEIVAGVLAGQRIVVHCKGGLGRAGTVAAMLLLQAGEAMTVSDAIRMVRHVRPGAIETRAQEEFLDHWARSLRPVCI